MKKLLLLTFLALSTQCHEFIGKHLLGQYSDGCVYYLKDKNYVTKVMTQGIEEAGATILSVHSEDFPGGGYSIVFILSESHATIHAYPEYNACFIDLFTCGTTCDPVKFHYRS